MKGSKKIEGKKILDIGPGNSKIRPENDEFLYSISFFLHPSPRIISGL